MKKEKHKNMPKQAWKERELWIIEKLQSKFTTK